MVDAELNTVLNISYQELKLGTGLSSRIEGAFGQHGLGLLTISHVPDFTQLRQKLLPLAKRFAELPNAVKAKHERPESLYMFGWSHGKEKLQGAPDVFKGSYYANPQYDRPVADENLLRQYPTYASPNVWPDDDLPELQGAFKTLGQLIVDVGALLAKQCDSYVRSRCASYEEGHLERMVRTSPCCKARLLHYFPPPQSQADGHLDPTPQTGANLSPVAEEQDEDNAFSNWCGWHNDHGALTGLVPAMYLDHEGHEVACEDPKAGLYVRSRQGRLVSIKLPHDRLAFQIGETAQIHSGGQLQATPHAVRASSQPGVSRETFAVFMQPRWDEVIVLPKGVSPDSIQTGGNAALLPKGVPSLSSRWRPNMSFGDFAADTIAAYASG